eukprot:985322-Pelagomonas_calceolata.AAC.3
MFSVKHRHCLFLTYQLACLQLAPFPTQAAQPPDSASPVSTEAPNGYFTPTPIAAALLSTAAHTCLLPAVTAALMCAISAFVVAAAAAAAAAAARITAAAGGGVRAAGAGVRAAQSGGGGVGAGRGVACSV